MTFTLLLFGHWVGDFLFQSTAMATKKSKSLGWLSYHVLVYYAFIQVTAIILFDIRTAFYYAVINGILHWVVDFFTSRVAAMYYSKPRILYPIIGFDQFLHVTCLWITFQNTSYLKMLLTS
jgi:hypothetical protein